jgi:hypothetical protein
MASQIMTNRRDIQLRAVIGIEKVLSVDLNLWNIVVALRRHSAHQCCRDSRQNVETPHFDTRNERRSINERKAKLLAVAWYSMQSLAVKWTKPSKKMGNLGFCTRGNGRAEAAGTSCKYGHRVAMLAATGWWRA